MGSLDDGEKRIARLHEWSLTVCSCHFRGDVGMRNRGLRTSCGRRFGRANWKGNKRTTLSERAVKNAARMFPVSPLDRLVWNFLYRIFLTAILKTLLSTEMPRGASRWPPWNRVERRGQSSVHDRTCAKGLRGDGIFIEKLDWNCRNWRSGWWHR